MPDRVRRLTALVARIAGPRFVVAALPPFLALAFVVTQTIGIIDWPGIARRTSAWGPASSALLVVIAVAAWARSNGPALTRAAQAPALGFAWRAPLGDAAWAAALAPLWLLSGLPVAIVGWFARGPWWPIEPVALLAAWPAVVAAAAHPRRLAVASVVGIGLVALARVAPPVWLGIALAAPAWAWLGARLTRTRDVGESGVRPAPRPRSPLAALLRHDALAIWRLDARVLPALLAPVPIVALAGHRLAPTPAVAIVTVLALLGLSAPTFAAPLGRLVERLGARLDPAGWPVQVGLRVLALWLVVALSAAPASAAALATATSPGDAARVLGLVAALASGAVWLSVGPMRGGVRRLALGAFLFWSLTATVASWVPWPRGAAVDLGLAAAGAALARRALARQRGRP